MTVAAPDRSDLRFGVPLYNLGEAAQYLRVPESTLRTWADGYARQGTSGQARTGDPVIAAFEATEPGGPRLPFIGITEAFVLNAFRKAGVPLQRIRPSLDWLKANVGEHALASERLYTDGAEVLWRSAEETAGGEPGLLVPRLSQYVFHGVVSAYLRQVRFGDDGFPASVRLAQYGDANVVLDPNRNFGRPVFAETGVPLDIALGRLRSGESIEDTADDFGLPVEALSAALLSS